MMKKKLLCGFLTTALLTQPVYAVTPGHYQWCTCPECKLYDEIYAPFFDGLTDVIIDSFKESVVEQAESSTQQEQKAEARWIPETFPERESHFRNNLPEYNSTIYCSHVDWINAGYKGIDAVVLNLNNSIKSKKDFPAYSAYNVQGFSAIRNEFFANSSSLSDVFEKASIWSRTVTLKDMLHISEALGNGTNLLAVEINPNYISNLIVDTEGNITQHGKSYMEGAPLEDHTVIISGIGIENEQMYIYLLDPYNTKIILKVNQQELYNATIGSGHTTMFVLDTNQ